MTPANGVRTSGDTRVPVPPRHAAESAFIYYKRLRRVKEHFELHLSEEFSLVKAAGIAAMNETYFSEFFHDKVGVGFKEWVNSVRIERAKELMRVGNSTISNIAFDVGFGTLRTFERAFKKHTALTPSEYKQRVRPSPSSAGSDSAIPDRRREA